VVKAGTVVVGGFKFDVNGYVTGGEPPYQYVIRIFLYPAVGTPRAQPMSIVDSKGLIAEYHGTYDPNDFNNRLEYSKAIGLPSWMQGWSVGEHKARAYASVTITDTSGHSKTFVSDWIVFHFNVVDDTNNGSSGASGGGGIPPYKKHVLPMSVEVLPLG
jgi:hypothetical protein